MVGKGHSKETVLTAIGKTGAMYALQVIDNNNLLYLVNIDGYVSFDSKEPYRTNDNDYDYAKLFHTKRDGSNFTLYSPSDSVKYYLLKKSDFLRVPYNESQAAYYPVVRSGEWYVVSSSRNDTPCVFTLNDDMSISEGGKTLSLCGTFWSPNSRWLSNNATYALNVTGAVGHNTENMFEGYIAEPMSIPVVSDRTVRDVQMAAVVSKETNGYDYLGNMVFTPNEKKMVERLTTAFADVLTKRDNNNDGKLGPVELTELAKATQTTKPAKTVQRLIMEFDVDGDGKLSQDDINKYLQNQKNKLIAEFNKQFPTGEFKTIDTNGDGKLSKEELKKYAIDRKLPNAAFTIESIFKLLDVDNSGFIEASELKK